jgi:hypothetical protein
MKVQIQHLLLYVQISINRSRSVNEVMGWWSISSKLYVIEGRLGLTAVDALSTHGSARGCVGYGVARGPL